MSRVQQHKHDTIGRWAVFSYFGGQLSLHAVGDESVYATSEDDKLSARRLLSERARGVLLEPLRQALAAGQQVSWEQTHADASYQVVVQPITTPDGTMTIGALAAYDLADAVLPSPPLVGTWQWTVGPDGKNFGEDASIWNDDLYRLHEYQPTNVTNDRGPAGEWLNKLVPPAEQQHVTDFVNKGLTICNNQALVLSMGAVTRPGTANPGRKQLELIGTAMPHPDHEVCGSRTASPARSPAPAGHSRPGTTRSRPPRSSAPTSTSPPSSPSRRSTARSASPSSVPLAGRPSACTRSSTVTSPHSCPRTLALTRSDTSSEHAARVPPAASATARRSGCSTARIAQSTSPPFVSIAMLRCLGTCCSPWTQHERLAVRQDDPRRRRTHAELHRLRRRRADPSARRQRPPHRLRAPARHHGQRGQAPGPRSPVIEFDAANDADAERLPVVLREHVDHLDGLVHCISASLPSVVGDGFMTANWKDVEHSLRVSAYSLQALTVAVAELLRDGSSVVGCTLDTTAAWPFYGWAGVAKAAYASVNQYLAHHLGPRGIRCNLVAAGPVASATMLAVPGAAELQAIWDDRSPLGWDDRGRAAVAITITTLLTDALPGVTGEVIHCDGGFHARAY